MSTASSGISGGQPSTTQPRATPWLSPKVVTRKRWPNVLWDMRNPDARFGSPHHDGGQIGAPTLAPARAAQFATFKRTLRSKDQDRIGCLPLGYGTPPAAFRPTSGW